MSDIQQLARKNISVRRKRPPLPPARSKSSKLKYLSHSYIGLKKLPPKHPPPPHLSGKPSLIKRPPPSLHPPVKQRRNSGTKSSLKPIQEKDESINLYSPTNEKSFKKEPPIKETSSSEETAISVKPEGLGKNVQSCQPASSINDIQAFEANRENDLISAQFTRNDKIKCVNERVLDLSQEPKIQQLQTIKPEKEKRRPSLKICVNEDEYSDLVETEQSIKTHDFPSATHQKGHEKNKRVPKLKIQISDDEECFSSSESIALTNPVHDEITKKVNTKKKGLGLRINVDTTYNESSLPVVNFSEEPHNNASSGSYPQQWESQESTGSSLPSLNCLPRKYSKPKQNRYNKEAITIGNFEIGDSGVKYTGTESPKGCFMEKSLKDDLLMLSVLGAGAGGTVYKALHIPTMKLVAVKTIPVYDSAKREQMIKELRTLHGNIAPIDDSGDAPNCPYVVGFFDAYVDAEKGHLAMVEEYMNGGSLQDIIDTGGCSAENALAQICYRVLKGLEYIHERKQIHRDIKPSNLLINHKGEVKISDFGIVRELDSTQAIASTFVGTLTYMSPERILGEQYTANCDVWSFGLSIMSCAFGYFPLATQGGYWGILNSVNEQPVPELPSDQFSDVFRDFILLCLQKDYKLRPSVHELLKHPFVFEIGKQIESELSEGNVSSPDEEFEHEGGLADLEEICQSIGAWWTKKKKEPLSPRGLSEEKLHNLSHQTGIGVQNLKQRLDQAIALG